MEKERKQITVSDMQDRLTTIGHKAAFLHDMTMPIADQELHLSYDGSEGLSAILGEIAAELKEIGNGEISEHHTSEPLPLRREA